MTTTTTTKSVAQERIETRNRRYKYAKQNAERANALFLELSKVVGVELTPEQVRNLLYVAHSFELANDSADRTYELYSDFCQLHDYKERDITFLYPYSN
jgi:hypothetical protein